MFHHTPIKHSPPQLSINPSLQNMVVDLAPEQEEAISAGGHLPVILIFFAQPSQPQAGKQGGYMTVLTDYEVK
ncbi:hypothetical protein ACN4EK_00470 [Pantanalinema rosaneae CENA516]|uniref:hypothetical protein n=1 Tax=Pantanalinema rosaneae TaxID=1620701 RepID=UPI003D6DF08E